MKTFDQIIDGLTYGSYKANRGYSPDITPEQWQKIYPAGTVASMEERYQKEMNPSDQILTTVAEYEAKIAEAFERGKLYEREKAKLDYSYNMGCDRYINTLGSVLERNNIISPVEGVQA